VEEMTERKDGETAQMMFNLARTTAAVEGLVKDLPIFANMYKVQGLLYMTKYKAMVAAGFTEDQALTLAMDLWGGSLPCGGGDE
jgi:phage-related minor tail protein